MAGVQTAAVTGCGDGCYTIGVKPDEKIVIFLTFLTGLFAGAALYITFYAPQYETEPVPERSQLVVIGEQRGGCALGPGDCPSFRLTDDRSYQYLTNGERTEGTLPRQIAQPLYETITTFRLRSLAAPIDSDSCRSAADGIEYRYEITWENTRYVLDTCRTSLSHTSELQQQLLAAWEYMENPTTTYPTIIEEGIGGWLIERFRGE